MASNPPAACCTVGHEHQGTPTGTFIKISNNAVNAYLVEPPSSSSHQHHPKSAVLFLSDILGFGYKNNQLLADRFAAAGYLTLAPDLYNGDPYPLTAHHQNFADLAPTDADLVQWATHGSNGKNPHTPEQIDPVIEAAIVHLRQNLGVERIVAVGYCLGAKYVVRHMRGAHAINAGFLAHPSYVTEDELKAMIGPLSIAAAQTDLIFTVDLRYRTEELLREKGGVWNIALYSGVAHGFAIRGDENDPTDVWAADEAYLQAVRFFNSPVTKK
ncbi:putative cytoplasm protein [Xylariales sp. PMI_506]|nr:putative cytoplasm protein [Xylariales sp. PMI_506]